MRIVIDTNIWVSGLLWQGLPWHLLRLSENERITLCIAPAIIDELSRVLNYHRLQSRLAQLGLQPADLVAYVINLAALFEPQVDRKSPIVAIDPDDDIFLHCAEVAGARYVVSGDRHLLDLGHYAGIPIVTIREFLVQEFPHLKLD